MPKKQFSGLFVLLFFLSAPHFITAQISAADTGKIELVQDHKIKELVARHVQVNSKAPVKGYRIKIHFGGDKNRAKEVKAKFILKFPEYKAYEKYDVPNFNIRVGDFRSKLEAYNALKLIQPEFPSSFIVQDEIEMPDLNPAVPKK